LWLRVVAGVAAMRQAAVEPVASVQEQALQ
jgi:hypothetical protein